MSQIEDDKLHWLVKNGKIKEITEKEAEKVWQTKVHLLKYYNSFIYSLEFVLRK